MGKNWEFAANDAVTEELWLRRAQNEFRKRSLLSPIDTSDAPPLTKYDHLYWDIVDALAAYRQDLHGYLFPEYAWAHDHIC